MKLKILSVGQWLGWLWASTIYGICLIVLGLNQKLIGEDWDFWFGNLVFFVSWLIGVMLLRYYVQDKNPTDFRDLLGIKKK